MGFEQGLAGRLARGRVRGRAPAATVPLIVVFVLAASAGSSSAQSPGQWWWVAQLGLASEAQESTLNGGDSVVGMDHDELLVSYGIRGFTLHPSVGRFGIDLDLLLANNETREATSTDRYGVGGQLRLFPQGAVPTSLRFRQQNYERSGGRFDAPIVLGRIADSATSYGAGVQVRRGALRGISATVDHRSIDYLDPTWRDQVHDRQAVTWLRTTPKGNHRVQLDRRSQQYAFDVDMDSLTLRVDERQSIGQRWRWEAYGDAVEREVSSSTADTITDTFRLRTRARRFIGGNGQRDTLTLRALIGTTGVAGLPSRDQRALSAEYQWRPKPGLEAGPFARYAREGIDGFAREVPSFGVYTAYQQTLNQLHYQVGGRTFYSVARRPTPTMSTRDERLGFAFVARVGHGNGRGLRKEFAIDASRDEINFDRDPIEEVPGLDLGESALLTTDRLNVRGSLTHSWDSSHLKGAVDWRREEANGDRPRTAESLRGNLNVRIRRLSLQAQLAQTDVDLFGNDQDVRSATGALVWRPRRYLRFKARYRDDRRDLRIGPKVDNERLDAEVEFQLGSLQASVLAFRNVVQVEDGDTYDTRGFRVVFSSRFSGWLPVVSGTRTRGVVR